MKKTMIFAAAAAMFMFSSCQKEELKPGQNSQSEELVFTATIDQNSSKTTINTTDGKIEWAEGDEITITDAKGTSVDYVAESSGASVSFSKKKGAEGSLASGSTYSATYKAAPSTSQQYTDYYSDDNQAKDLYMTAPSIDGTTLTFKAACGLLKLNLKASSDITDKTISEIKVFGKVNSNDVIYTLTCSSAQNISSAKDFYIALPAGDYSVFKFTNSTGHICYKTAQNAMAIANNEIQPVTLTGIVFNDMLPGKFTVASGSQVRFSNGNLYCKRSSSSSSDWTWGFYEDQYKYNSLNTSSSTKRTVESTDTEIDLFCWGYDATGSVNPLEQQTRTSFTDWGTITSLPTVTNGWKTLTDGEWTYLLNTTGAASGARTDDNRFAKAMVNSVKGLIIFPDGYAGTTSGGGIAEVNSKTASFPESSIADATWKSMESAGCVFLPFAGTRTGDEVSYTTGNNSIFSCYWAATVSGTTKAYSVQFNKSDVKNTYKDSNKGSSVRLVSTVSN